MQGFEIIFVFYVQYKNDLSDNISEVELIGSLNLNFKSFGRIN